jgi:hypothetical protein
MAPFGRGRIEPDQRQALSHPVRRRIFELFTRDTDRPMAAGWLIGDLVGDFPEVKVRNVAYHVTVLKDAQLVPAR